MAKRVAGSQLTDRNWDQDEEPEEAGVFKAAGDEIMKERKVIKARRKIESGAAGSDGSSAFKGFAGFSFQASTGGSSLFSFGPKNPDGEEKKPMFSISKATTSDTSEKKPATNGFSKSEGGPNKAKYLKELKSLNESVTKWIKGHVDKNPYCILTPIFNDYAKYLSEIEKNNPDKKKAETETQKNEKSGDKKPEVDSDVAKPTVASGLFSFGTASSTSSSKPASSLGSSSTTTAAGTSLFSFGKSSSSSSTTGASVFGGASSGASGFSFTSSTAGSVDTKGFSFATGDGNSGEKAATAETEEVYVPPVVEVNEVKEDDAIYSKRCKLYYQNEGTWTEKGVGNLHLKPCNDKTQLLIRADTSLGNILLNIMLSTQIPFKRQGKNNVSLICVPNPALDPKMDEKKPVNMLLRVKTAEDADELLDKINSNKS